MCVFVFFFLIVCFFFDGPWSKAKRLNYQKLWKKWRSLVARKYNFGLFSRGWETLEYFVEYFGYSAFSISWYGSLFSVDGVPVHSRDTRPLLLVFASSQVFTPLGCSMQKVLRESPFVYFYMCSNNVKNIILFCLSANMTTRLFSETTQVPPTPLRPM